MMVSAVAGGIVVAGVEEEGKQWGLLWLLEEEG